jgi:predicted RNA methylase
MMAGMARPKKLSHAAVDVLASMACEGNLARITAGQLDRILYLEVNGALEALGGKWVRKLKAHAFDGDPLDAIDQVVVDGQFSDAKRDFEVFETPLHLAEEVVEQAGVKDYDLVLEPSAGTGALIDAVYTRSPLAQVFAVEVQPSLVAKLQTRNWVTGTNRLIVHTGDFLALEPQPRYRCCVMNPPFSRQKDIDHVVQALRWLAPGGKLVAIMSAGTGFRTNRKAADFRSLVDSLGGSIEPIAPGAFKSSGTMVNTVLVEMTAA